MCSHLLSVMVQDLTGQKVVDFLGKRLFEPLGITNYYWEEDLLGHNTGGFGLHLATQDLAKYGLCLLHHGVYNGQQVIPESWVTVATAKQVENASEYPVARRTDRDMAINFGCVHMKPSVALACTVSCALSSPRASLS